MKASSKRQNGRYFTAGNPFRHRAFRAWARRAKLPASPVLEPFAGSGSLLRHLEAMGLCNESAAFDIHPAGPGIRKRDTLKAFPKGYPVCITNPPWLAKNSATVRGLPFPAGQYDDLYKFALEKCLSGCNWVAALVPESFIRAKLFQSRLTDYISLTPDLFTDTGHPVGLAMFQPGHSPDVRVWSRGARLGLLSRLEALRPLPRPGGPLPEPRRERPGAKAKGIPRASPAGATARPVRPGSSESPDGTRRMRRMRRTRRSGRPLCTRGPAPAQHAGLSHNTPGTKSSTPCARLRVHASVSTQQAPAGSIMRRIHRPAHTAGFRLSGGVRGGRKSRGLWSAARQHENRFTAHQESVKVAWPGAATRRPGGAKMARKSRNVLYTGDNLYVLNGMNSESVDLIYLDPPFNSKRIYAAPIGSKSAGASFKDIWTWNDVDEAYLERMIGDYPQLVRLIEAVENIHGRAMMSYLTFMAQRVLEMHRVLKRTGSLFLHCDPVASHYLKLILDTTFGKQNFKNEIVWSYKSGGSGKRWLSRKHDTILYYAKDTPSSVFNVIKEKSYNRELKPYRFKGVKEYQDEVGWYTLVNMKDVWQIDMVGRTSPERTGYPTQKPLELLHRVIQMGSNKGDVVLDPFCGCATTCVAAQQLGRHWIGIDVEDKSADLVVQRLSDDAGLFSDFVHRTEPPARTDIEAIDLEKPKNKREVKERLGQEYGRICNGCGMDNWDNLEVDHIVPGSKGGQHVYENYQLLCGNCNRIKGDRPMEYLVAKIRWREELLEKKLTFARVKR